MIALNSGQTLKVADGRVVDAVAAGGGHDSPGGIPEQDEHSYQLGLKLLEKHSTEWKRGSDE